MSKQLTASIVHALLLPVTACYCLFAALFCLENIEFRKWEIICRRDPPLTKIISDIWAGATFFFFALLHPFFSFSHNCATFLFRITAPLFFFFCVTVPLFSFSRHCATFFLFRITAPFFLFFALLRHFFLFRVTAPLFFFFALLHHFFLFRVTAPLFSFSRYCATFFLFHVTALLFCYAPWHFGVNKIICAMILYANYLL